MNTLRAGDLLADAAALPGRAPVMFALACAGLAAAHALAGPQLADQLIALTSARAAADGGRAGVNWSAFTSTVSIIAAAAGLARLALFSTLASSDRRATLGRAPATVAGLLLALLAPALALALAALAVLVARHAAVDGFGLTGGAALGVAVGALVVAAVGAALCLYLAVRLAAAPASAATGVRAPVRCAAILTQGRIGALLAAGSVSALVTLALGAAYIFILWRGAALPESLMFAGVGVAHALTIGLRMGTPAALVRRTHDLLGALET